MNVSSYIVLQTRIILRHKPTQDHAYSPKCQANEEHSAIRLAVRYLVSTCCNFRDLSRQSRYSRAIQRDGARLDLR